jgi:APA family basic amino acid/polyamine antiporter
MGASEVAVFRRKASGLVRYWGFFDLFVYNVFPSMLLLAGYAYLYSQGPWAFPGGSMPVAILLGGLLGTPLFVGYAMLGVTMPRSGGDYVFQSRTIHGSVGFMSMMAMALSLFVWIALMGVWLGTFGLSPGLVSLGLYLNSPELISSGLWFSTPLGAYVSMLVVNTLSFVLFVAGMSTALRLQRFCYFISLIGVGFAIIQGLLYDKATFLARFNAVQSQLGGAVYDDIVKAAHNAGFIPDFSFSWYQTLALMPLVWLVLAWVMWGLLNLGEVKEATNFKKMTAAVLGSLWFNTILMLLVVIGLLQAVGQEFMAYVGWGFYTGSITYPVQPWFSFFLDILGPSVIPAIFITVTMALTAFFQDWCDYVGGSRIMLAASLDRALPDRIGHVSDKYHQPMNIGLVYLIVPLFVTYAYLFTPFYFYTLTLSAIASVFMFFTSVSFMVFPFLPRMTDTWNASPASKYKIGGIPVIVLCGLEGIIFNAILIFYEFHETNLLMNSQLGVVGFAALFIGLFALWWIAWVRWRRKGLDLSLSYREVPPI